MIDDLHSPNWLLRGLIVLSVGAHLLILLQIAQLHRPKQVSKIELTLRSISRRPQHHIPKPSPQIYADMTPIEKHLPQKVDPQAMLFQPFQYQAPDPVDKNALRQKKPLPSIPVVDDPEVISWQEEMATSVESGPNLPEAHITAERTYTDQIKRQIEAVKQYPQRARRRNIQGVVDIVFTIGKEGEIVTIAIAKSSGSRILDRAAVDAVNKASPFDKPPKGPLTIQLPMVFKLYES